MTAVSWQQFGLRKDPFDTLPLVEGGDLPLEKAFVGRDVERDFLDGLLDSEERLCLVIGGRGGVGKTSLANFEKFLWKYEKSKLLFSARKEIEVQPELLNKRAFISEILSSTLRELRLRDLALVEKNDFLQHLSRLVDVTQSFSLSLGASIYGFGASAGGAKNVIPPHQITLSTLEGYLSDLVRFLRNNEIGGFRYSGLLVHVNNFEIVMGDSTQNVSSFFQEIRDVLQFPNTYFLFLGPQTLYKNVISKHDRVRSIFHQVPLLLNPLSKKEIVKALQERMELLKSEQVSGYLNPFEDEVIYRLYDLYEGDIRSIMSSLRDILGQHSGTLSRALGVDEALFLLGRERWNHIENMGGLKKGQKEFLIHLVTHYGEVSQAEVAKNTGKAQSNVSGFYFKPLAEHGIIEVKRTEGRSKYWGLTNTYMPITFVLESQRRLQQRLPSETEQLDLFTSLA